MICSGSDSNPEQNIPTALALAADKMIRLTLYIHDYLPILPELIYAQRLSDPKSDILSDSDSESVLEPDTQATSAFSLAKSQLLASGNQQGRI